MLQLLCFRIIIKERELEPKNADGHLGIKELELGARSKSGVSASSHLPGPPGREGKQTGLTLGTSLASPDHSYL